MSNLSPRPPESSEWIWLSLVPVFGGLAIANAGKKTNNQSWLSVGKMFLRDLPEKTTIPHRAGLQSARGMEGEAMVYLNLTAGMLYTLFEDIYTSKM